MLRLSRPRPLLRGRSLVSSVLLNRSWDKASITDLRTEAKARGLPVGGNKATIIARLQNFDRNLARAPEPSARSTSTNAATPHRKSFPPPAGEKGLAPGIPPNSIRTLAEPSFNIKLPNITQPNPVRPVQIPYLPDFWESSAAKNGPEEQPLPKLLIVGDANALHGGVPEETIWSEPLSESSEAEPPLPGKGDIFSDIAGDFGLAPWGEIRKNWRRMIS